MESLSNSLILNYIHIIRPEAKDLYKKLTVGQVPTFPFYELCKKVRKNSDPDLKDSQGSKHEEDATFCKNSRREYREIWLGTISFYDFCNIYSVQRQ